MDMTPLKQAGVESLKLREAEELRDAVDVLLDADDAMNAHASEARDNLFLAFDSAWNAKGLELATEVSRQLREIRKVVGRE